MIKCLSIVILFVALEATNCIPSIPLTKRPYGYTVEVDADDTIKDSTTKRLVLALYQNEPIFMPMYAPNCMEFSTFTCEGKCTRDPKGINILRKLPYYSTTSNDILLSYTLGNGSYTIPKIGGFLNICPKNEQAFSAANDALGFLGLGLNSSQSFSVYLSNNSDSHELLFGGNWNYGLKTHSIKIKTNVETEEADGTTRTLDPVYTFKVEKFLVEEKSIVSENQLSAFFDINSEEIGIPEEIYNKLIKELKEYGVSDCNSMIRPTCSLKNTLAGLPIFYINTTETTIPIPPAMYVVDYFTLMNSTEEIKSITLSIKATVNTRLGKSFVQSDFANHIILGAPFLTYYYTVFGADGTVTLYQANHFDKTSNLPSMIFALIFGGITFLALIVALLKCRSTQSIQKAIDKNDESTYNLAAF